MESKSPAQVSIIDADTNRDDCEEQALGKKLSEEQVSDADNDSELKDSRRSMYN